MSDQPSSRRFQFRLRTLIVVMAIVAVQCADGLPMLREWQRYANQSNLGVCRLLTISFFLTPEG